MDTLLLGGDHAVGGRGLPVAIGGVREIIQRALIRLSVRKGGFAPDIALGSELWRLSGVRAELRDRVAAGYVREALLPIRGLSVVAVSCETPEPDRLTVKTELEIGEGTYDLEVNIS
jgi:hypothetical protein